MSWNYRVVRYPDGSMGIHEVYYDDDGEPWACTDDAVGAVGESSNDLLVDLTRMIECLTQPILEYEDF